MGFANAGGVVHVRPLYHYRYIHVTYIHTYLSRPLLIHIGCYVVLCHCSVDCTISTPLLIRIGHVWFCSVRLAVYGRCELWCDHHTVVVGRGLSGRVFEASHIQSLLQSIYLYRCYIYTYIYFHIHVLTNDPSFGATTVVVGGAWAFR